MPNDLEGQLAEVFSRGLDADPDLRQSLEEALGSTSSSSKPTPEDKATKAEANYREGNDAQECGICTHYDAPNRRCELVSGNISPSSVSDYFESVGEEDDGDTSRKLES